MSANYEKVRNLQELSYSYMKLAAVEKLPEKQDEALASARTCLDKAKTIVEGENDKIKLPSQTRSKYANGNGQSANTIGEGSIEGDATQSGNTYGEGSDARAASS